MVMLGKALGYNFYPLTQSYFTLCQHKLLDQSKISFPYYAWPAKLLAENKILCSFRQHSEVIIINI
jgi:hypothetical protein